MKCALSCAVRSKKKEIEELLLHPTKITVASFQMHFFAKFTFKVQYITACFKQIIAYIVTFSLQWLVMR
jgi:hypothetical protein